MKILTLDLQAFGPFTGVSLDFSGGSEGLHIIFGPNEAGKSSAMRGLRQALFGFPNQSPDDFLHDYKKFRIGFRLRDDHGNEQSFVRRKGQKNNSLLDPNGSTVPESILAGFLGGLTEEEFTHRYALDHDELVAGGRSILEGSGELGQLLFQAGGGLRDLIAVQRQLDRELEALFKPAGSKPRINETLSLLKEARNQVRLGSLPSSEWAEHDAAHRRASEELASVEEQLESARAEKSRLDRIAAALPILARRDQETADLSALGAVVDLPDDFPEHRRQAENQVETARIAESAALHEVEEIEARLATLVVDDALLDRADAVERLRDALAGYRKAEAALPGEIAHLQRIEEQIREILAELRPETATPETGPKLLEAAEALRLTPAIKSRIKKLDTDFPRHAAEHDHAIADVAALEDRIRSDQEKLDRIGEPGDPGPIAEALRSAREQGDLDDKLAEARLQLDRKQAEAELALRRLPLWSGTLDDLVSRPSPSAETIDRAEAELAGAEAEVTRLRSAREAAEADADAAATRLDQIRESAGLLPTEEDLETARARRDRIWRTIRTALDSGEPPVPAAIEEPEDQTEPEPLAPALERAITRADAIADRLRREADRVAAQAAARADRERARQRSSALEGPIQEAAARLVEIQTRWQAAWKPTGIDHPLSPREMRGWLQARASIVQKVDEARGQGVEVRSLFDRIAAHRRAIFTAMAGQADETYREEFSDFADSAISDDSAARINRNEGAPLGPLRDRAEAVVNRIDQAKARREHLIQSMGESRRKLEAARGRARVVEERLRDWRESWGRAVAPIGLAPESSPEQADAVIEQMDELLSRVREARQAVDRIEGGRREVEQFAGEVRAFDDLPGAGGMVGVADRAQDLIRRLALARKAADDREALHRRRDLRRREGDDARARREAATARLEAMVREAGAASVDDLPAAERASTAARSLRDRIRDRDGQLGGLCGAESIAAFRALCASVDADRLPGRIEAIASEVNRLSAHRDTLIDERARLRTELARMDGEGPAAEANERVEALRSRLSGEVEEYARLRLAAVVLREAIESYRTKVQGPVLERAGTLFAELTLGSFRGLQIDETDPDRPSLAALRPAGEEPPTVGIRGLSLGTADQLYLALRLAGLETALDARGPVPLVADDLLIQFDERRTAAALNALATLARRAQVLLFTHHEHVCECARSTVSHDQLFIHRLHGRPDDRSPIPLRTPSTRREHAR